MKKNDFLKSLLLLVNLVGIQTSVYADEFICPSINDFQNFASQVIEYPISKDIETQHYNQWLVAQFNIKKLLQHQLKALIISPVKPEREESAFETSEKMLSAFIPDNNNTPFHDHLSPTTELYACSYTNPQTGAIANYIHLIAKKEQQLHPRDALIAFSKIKQHQ